ncbi:phosphoesterase [Methanosarcina sp. KYL-1]|uniref:DHH family phosphoesterase n=1 Tax=Methanosarcina sp. KYL-1 TaxID=2602068 RepID=UPI00210191D0|nr:DHH family phosphoesterase [Methanosarcina sp. KYL-1]MCQ1535422.1 phosphoesterase [Methanosarcina sp. KYL-1]
MSKECPDCHGRGYEIISTEVCPLCKGKGKSKSIDFMKISEKDIDSFLKNGAECEKCKGTGKIEVSKPCESCRGLGNIFSCKVCGTRIYGAEELEDEICSSCSRSQYVYALDDSCDLKDVEAGKLYHGIVSSAASFGVFVDLNSHVRGLMHSSNVEVPPDVGDAVIVLVKSIKAGGKLDLIPKTIAKYETIELEKELPVKNSAEIEPSMKGRLIRIEGEVIQVKQTSGPTIFTISDEGGFVPCAAFESAGKRAYPHIDVEMVVSITGEVTLRDEQVQIEVMSMKLLTGAKEVEVRARVERVIEEKAAPADIPFLVESEIMEKLKPQMLHVAKEIKKAIFHSKPIILRHHADADGITSAIAIERAILPLITEIGGADAEYYFYKRAPSKAPFYELADVTRDISFALEDASRHGQKMPLVILVDNGSTEEDVPSMRQARVYDIDLLVIDHHHPDEIVDQFLIGHVNPAHVGGDFGVTAGMLCAEVARMINPDVSNTIRHLPAVSAVGDRSEAPEAGRYIGLASDRYTLADLKEMALALDYEQFWLKFSSGKGLIDDILDLGDHKTHKRLVSLLCEQANTMIKDQLDTCLSNVKSHKLANGAIMNVIDVENYAQKFTFPPPGKTSGEVHDVLCKRNPDKPVVTIGYGPDFAVIRSKGVLMNIPRIVRELREELVGAGVNGGGHLVVGSIKFVEGMRTEVLSRLAEKIASVEVEF